MNKKRLFSVILAGMLAASMSVTAFADVSEDAAPVETELVDDSAEMDADSSPVFTRGVWKLTIAGDEYGYLVFTDEENGRLERADGTGSTPFTCTQNGWEIAFHMGGPDDLTIATVSEGDAQITFSYEGNVITYDVEYVEDADPDNFSLSAIDDGEENEIEAETEAILDEESEEAIAYVVDTTNASDIGGAVASFIVTGDELKSASETTDLILYLKFIKAEPFSLTMRVHLVGGGEKYYEAIGSGKNAESYFPVKDMLDALHVTVDEVDKIDISGESSVYLKSVSFNNTGKSDGKDDNPATGVGLAVIPAFMSCAAMMLSKKRK